MGDSKKTKTFLDYAAPLFGWTGDTEESKKKWDEFKSGVETFVGQVQEIQKTVNQARKEAWNKVFKKIMEMEEKVADTLPEELPTPPGMPAAPVSPKEIVTKVKEFQEKANKHAVEQADAVIDLVKKGQEQVKEAVTDAVDAIEKNIEKKPE